MRKRWIAGALAAIVSVQTVCGLGVGSGTFDGNVLAKSKVNENCKVEQRMDYEPTPLSVKIGTKVKDSDISTGGISAQANSSTVNTKKAFMKKLHDYMNKRVTRFTIVFNGSYKKIYKNDIKAMFSQAWNIDNKNTSDDFDYLYGNIDTYSFRIPTYSANKSVFNFYITYRESASQLKKVNKEVKKVLSSLNLTGKSRVEKLRLIHDYIAENVSYDKTLSRFTAYDGLVSSAHTTVCQGYALLYYKMCTDVGIPCRFVGGYGTTGGYRISHAWNLVKVGNKWYYVDVTWDDTDRTDRPYVYEYFLVGSAHMALDHTLDSEYLTSIFKKKYPTSKKNYNWKIPISTVAPTQQPTVEPKETIKPTATVKPTETVIPTQAPMGTPLQTKAPGTTGEPIQYEITRDEYYRMLEKSYKKTWGYENATVLQTIIYNCYLSSLYDTILGLSDHTYSKLGAEYDENGNLTEEEKRENGALPYLKSFLTSFASNWNTYVTVPMNAYIGSDEFVQDVAALRQKEPNLTEEEAKIRVKCEQYENRYQMGKEILADLMIADAETILK